MKERTRQKLLLEMNEAAEGSKANIRKKVKLHTAAGHVARMVPVKYGFWKLQVLHYGSVCNPETIGTSVWLDIDDHKLESWL
jgi:hypothetical protein